MPRKDAAEYLQHLFTLLERTDRAVPGPKPVDEFKYNVEERYEDSDTKQVWRLRRP